MGFKIFTLKTKPITVTMNIAQDQTTKTQLFRLSENIPVSYIVINAAPVKIIAISYTLKTSRMGRSTIEKTVRVRKRAYSFTRGYRNSGRVVKRLAIGFRDFPKGIFLI
jgi:hypothetical protein